jgi:hypothetical protein
MKRYPVLVLAAALLAPAAYAAGASKPAVAPAAPASAPAGSASAPAKTPPRGVSAADAANSAQEPGKLRPAHETIPQIVLPLRAGAAKSGAASAPVGSGIDDAAARCAAQKTRAERQACRAPPK